MEIKIRCTECESVIEHDTEGDELNERLECDCGKRFVATVTAL